MREINREMYNKRPTTSEIIAKPFSLSTNGSTENKLRSRRPTSSDATSSPEVGFYTNGGEYKGIMESFDLLHYLLISVTMIQFSYILILLKGE